MVMGDRESKRHGAERNNGRSGRGREKEGQEVGKFVCGAELATESGYSLNQKDFFRNFTAIIV
eukprot:174558-Hanusia_phi.AAC.1